jgi:thymidylate kinase
MSPTGLGLAARPASDDETIRRTFAELDRHRVRWCLLRGEPTTLVAGDDVDLLVSKRDLPRTGSLLQELGYLQLASWGRGSHRFHVAYDRSTGSFLKLDVVTELSFGPHATIETATADACLARRVEDQGTWRLAPDDRFWALLLHCILDRRDVPDRHAAVLGELVAQATGDGPLAGWFAANAPAEWSTERAIAAAAQGRWADLMAVGQRILDDRRWRIDRPLARRLLRAAARRLTKVRRFAVEPGVSVAFLGPDGTGKSSMAAHLQESFFFPARPVYMGLYGGGQTRRRDPRGPVQHVTRTSGHLIRQWRRYAAAAFHRRRGRLVVYDRFGYDALLRKSANAPVMTRMRRWALAHTVPRPDLVVTLDAPAQVLYARKQEHDLERLESQRQAYLALSARLPNAAVVDTDRSLEEVQREVTWLIWREYLQRSLKRAARRR